MRWTPARYDQIEYAARNGLRVVVQRRGTEYVVLAIRVANGPNGEALHARLPMTGETMEFLLKEIEWFQVLKNDD
jgi:hypothetical protein